MEIQPQIEKSFENIYLVTKTDKYSLQQLGSLFPGKRLCVCDFPVSDSEAGTMPFGSLALSYSGILIIDHHADREEYRSPKVTSTTIASKYVSVHGPVGYDNVIVIHHTDTDSILSALIMSGTLAPTFILESASIAADHTGEENLIADTLQAMEEERDLALSIRLVKKLLEKRVLVRADLEALSSSGGFKWNGRIAWRIHGDSIDAGLLPAILENANVIVIASLMTSPGKKWKIRVRLGKTAKGIDLGTLGLPDFGGRWNAGSTSRTGGTDIEPEEYVAMIAERLVSTGIV